jgi:hypothetical protein
VGATGSIDTLVIAETAAVAATGTENWAANRAAHFAAIDIQGAAIPLGITASTLATDRTARTMADKPAGRTADSLGTYLALKAADVTA